MLAELLDGRKVLVAVDNVWDRAVLDALPPGCQMLFTTRSTELARNVNGMPIEVAELQLEQALELLGKWTERDRVELDRLPAEAICRGVDRLALGVAMCGAMIRQGDEQRWQDVLTLLQTADLERIKADFGDRYPHPTPLAAIQLGIDELPDEPTLDRAASATANSQYSRGADRSPAPPRRRCGWRRGSASRTPAIYSRCSPAAH